VDVEVLRTGHHGAANATNEDFIKAIKPEVAIISTGDNQKANYKHPRCVTYESLKAGSVGLVLQTELGTTDCTGPPPIDPVVVNGTIRIDVERDTYSITSYGTNSPANGGATKQVSYTCALSGGCTAGTPSPPSPSSCCRECTNGKPCGDTCISATASCTRPPGCACAGP
jgi:hypothetical protein